MKTSSGEFGRSFSTFLIMGLEDLKARIRDAPAEEKEGNVPPECYLKRDSAILSNSSRE